MKNIKIKYLAAVAFSALVISVLALGAGNDAEQPEKPAIEETVEKPTTEVVEVTQLTIEEYTAVVEMSGAILYNALDTISVITTNMSNNPQALNSPEYIALLEETYDLTDELYHKHVAIPFESVPTNVRGLHTTLVETFALLEKSREPLISGIKNHDLESLKEAVGYLNDISDNAEVMYPMISEALKQE